MKIDLSRINLNLLVVLDTLLKEEHVTRAGERLHLSQSAVSNLLKQLRELFQDELFVRGKASRMIPTAKALALKEPLAKWLDQGQDVLQQTTPFDPKTSKGVIRIGLSDYGEFVILPRLIQHFLKEAPHLDLEILPLTYLKDETPFEVGQLDLVIGTFLHVPQGLVSEVLFKDDLVVVGWKDNPLMRQPLTIAQFSEVPHFIPLYAEHREETMVESFLKKVDIQRRFALTVRSHVVALYNLINTSYICLSLRRLATALAEDWPLTIQQPMLPFPSIEVKMLWHTRHRQDALHQWLRHTIVRLLLS